MSKTEKPDTDQIADDVGFSEATLDDNMIRQPSLVAYYGHLVSEMQFDMDTLKQKLDIAESRAGQSLRDEAAEDGRKITESQINSTIPTVSSVVKARIAYNRAKADFEGLRIILEALRHKKDMMVQIGVNRRSEMESKISGLVREDRQKDSVREVMDQASKIGKGSKKAA